MSCKIIFRFPITDLSFNSMKEISHFACQSDRVCTLLIPMDLEYSDLWVRQWSFMGSSCICTKNVTTLYYHSHEGVQSCIDSHLSGPLYSAGAVRELSLGLGRHWRLVLQADHVVVIQCFAYCPNCSIHQTVKFGAAAYCPENGTDEGSLASSLDW